MVDMMYSEENYFLENEYATGFIKCFEGNKYCFVGILPKEKGPYQMGKINIESLLASKKETKTYIGMPKIKIESLNKLSNVYNKYNINEIFTDKANLHQMSNNDFYVSEIYQKETITIGEFGTVTSSTKTTALSTNTIDDSSKKVVLHKIVESSTEYNVSHTQGTIMLSLYGRNSDALIKELGDKIIENLRMNL